MMLVGEGAIDVLFGMPVRWNAGEHKLNGAFSFCTSRDRFATSSVLDYVNYSFDCARYLWEDNMLVQLAVLVC